MKKIILAFFLILLTSPVLADDPMNCCIPGRVHQQLSEEWVLEHIVFDQENAKKEGFDYWTAWGHEWRGETVDYLSRRYFYLVAKPREVSSRIWIMQFFEFSISSETREPIYKPDSISNISDCQRHPNCNMKLNGRYFVVPQGSKNFDPQDLMPSDFTIFETDIDKFRLVWLVDFLEAYLNASPGETLEVEGIKFIWPEKDFPHELNLLKNEERNWKINSISSNMEGYAVSFCRFLIKEKACLIWDGKITINFEFLSPKEITVSGMYRMIP